MTPLPGPMSFELFARFRAEPERWLPVALDIARGAGLACASPHVFRDGSNLVVALDDAVVLKIFPPMLTHQWRAERGCLAALAGKLTVTTPQIVADGQRDGWHWLAMTRVAGVACEDVWPTLTEGEKDAIIGRIGRLIDEVQSTTPTDDIRALEPRWHVFVPEQLARCRARHEGLGLPARLVTGIDDYLRDATSTIPLAPRLVILTGEYIQQNFMVQRDERGQWQVSGLIDFGDAMTGFGEYDLLGPSIFMCEGRHSAVRALLDGCHLQSSPELTRRLMTLLLLHRFSNLEAQIRIPGWQDRASSLAELERLIWPV